MPTKVKLTSKPPAQQTHASQPPRERQGGGEGGGGGEVPPVHKQKDMFKILDVTRESSKEDIRNAFMKKALKYHPDKAPEGKKERYEQIYADIQKAYKILMNDKARAQYVEASQKTADELKNTKRDIHYKKTKKYTKINKEGAREFDKDTFHTDFDSTRVAGDAEEYVKLNKKYDKGNTKVTESEIDLLKKQRDLERDEFKPAQIFEVGSKFDKDAFNRAFDHMKRNNPSSTDMQPYDGEPVGMFSGSTGLTELSGLNLQQGTNFSGANMDNMVTGSGYNPKIGELNLTEFTSSDSYWKPEAENYKTMMDKIEAVKKDRERLYNLGENEYINKPSEIEQQYSELFQINQQALEGIESADRIRRKNNRDKKGGI